MIDEVGSGLQGYLKKWQRLVARRSDKAFFEGLKPVAVGWKVGDETEYRKCYAELYGQCDKIVETWMNGRWIAKMHLRDTKLAGDVTIVKLMQRRPGSDDALGLDHVDFYSPAVDHAEEVLQKETDLKWTNENNDAVDNYDWISVWFDGTEAKLKSSTVIDIVIGELKELNATITKH